MTMLKTLVGAFIGAAIAISAVYYGAVPSNTTVEKAETAFERVQRTGELRCGYFSWPPYVMRDPNTGAMSGINVDFVNAIAAEMDWKVIWEAEVGAGDVVAGLETNKYDMMCASLWTDGPRAKTLTLTTPTFYTATYAFVRAGDARFDGDLNKMNAPDVTLSVMDGDITSTVARNNYPLAKTHSVPQNGDAADVMLNVATGKADAIIVGQAEIEYFNANNETKLQRVAGVEAAQVFPEVLAMKSGEHQFKEAVDAILQRLNTNGLGKKLLAKYKLDSCYPVQRGF